MRPPLRQHWGKQTEVYIYIVQYTEDSDRRVCHQGSPPTALGEGGDSLLIKILNSKQLIKSLYPRLNIKHCPLARGK